MAIPSKLAMNFYVVMGDWALGAGIWSEKERNFILMI